MYIQSLTIQIQQHTVQRKILTGENIDEFDEFPAIHQYGTSSCIKN